MQILTFTIKDQVLTAGCPGRVVVEASRGHVFARFALDEAWDGLAVTAVFQNDFVSQAYERVWTGEPVEVPPEVLVRGQLRVSLVGLGDGGAYRLTTRRMQTPIAVFQAGPLVALTPEEATPELWEQVLALMGDVSKLDTNDKSSLVAAINEVRRTGGGGGGAGLPPVTEADDGKVLQVVGGAWAAAELPRYDGAYSVTPSLEGATLQTARKLMDADIKIEKIPYAEVTNPANGTTVTIG